MKLLNNSFFAVIICGALLSCASLTLDRPGRVLESSKNAPTISSPPMGEETRVPKKVIQIADPQSYFHYMQGELAELSGQEATALQEYKAALAYDP
ncbi:MAG: hypothetical protein ACREIQ_08735, partial [Nitrospiria bacterium]